MHKRRWVAGIRTPKDIASLEEQMPHVHQQFVSVSQQLEQHYRDMQDIEFTIEQLIFYKHAMVNGQMCGKYCRRLVNEQVITNKKR